MNIIKVSASRWNFKDEILRFRCCNVLDWGNKNYIDHFGPSFNILKNFNNRMDSHKFVFFYFFLEIYQFISLKSHLNFLFFNYRYQKKNLVHSAHWYSHVARVRVEVSTYDFFLIYFFKKNLISRIEDTFE